MWTFTFLAARFGHYRYVWRFILLTFFPFPSLFSPELSVFDLLGDDGPYGNLEGSPVYEAHVAFSVEGKALLDLEFRAGLMLPFIIFLASLIWR